MLFSLVKPRKGKPCPDEEEEEASGEDKISEEGIIYYTEGYSCLITC
jgi:hypothetical protein